MATRVSRGGSYRLDKRFPAPVGRLAIATCATTRKAYTQAEACVLRLAERGRLDVLLALKAGQVRMPQVLSADRAGTLDALMAGLRPRPEDAPLWATVEAWLGPVAEQSATAVRYRTSFRQLERAAVLKADARVSDLAAVDWTGLAQRWMRSPSDWNHLRRAVSRFLSVQYGDKYDPRRRAVVEKIPKRAERERVPDLDVSTFWRVVEAAPEHLRASYVCLVALGLRVGEYLRMRPEHLHPITKTVSVPGSKTAASAAVLCVDPDLWPWVTQAVPAPVSYYWLRECWKRALKAVGADESLRLHDLRHLPAQMLVAAGESEASVQTFMRHKTASMTRRYARQRDRGQNAATLARVLLEARTA
jgi:integrase